MRDQSQDFEQLRQLLALKRHETPPPGYFRDFSSRVIDRIERDQATSGAGWLRQMITFLRIRPAISASFCVATSLVLLAASTLWETDPAGSSARTPSIEPQILAAPEPNAQASASSVVFFTNLEPRGFTLDIAPQPAPQTPTNSLFNPPFRTSLPRVEPVNYNLELVPYSR